MKQIGFSVIELILALLILGILSAVVLPAYLDPDYDEKHLTPLRDRVFVICKDHEGELHQASGIEIVVEGNVVRVKQLTGNEKLLINMDCWTEDETTKAPEQQEMLTDGS